MIKIIKIILLCIIFSTFILSNNFTIMTENFKNLRKEMVEKQLKARGIKSEIVFDFADTL